MIIEKEYIPILSDALESFTLQPEEYNIPYDIYTSTEFEEFHTGFSTNDAKALIEFAESERLEMSANSGSLV